MSLLRTAQEAEEAVADAPVLYRTTDALAWRAHHPSHGLEQPNQPRLEQPLCSAFAQHKLALALRKYRLLHGVYQRPD